MFLSLNWKKTDNNQTIYLWLKLGDLQSGNSANIYPRVVIIKEQFATVIRPRHFTNNS